MYADTAVERYQEVVIVARQLFQQGPDWVTFFREVMGIEGIVRQAFPKPDDLLAFEKSDAFEEIQKMLAMLRVQSNHQSEADDTEPTRVITVRLPKSLHDSLKTEAHERKTSMNKLCISKLLQIVDEVLVPAGSENGAPRRSGASQPAEV